MPKWHVQTYIVSALFSIASKKNAEERKKKTRTPGKWKTGKDARKA